MAVILLEPAQKQNDEKKTRRSKFQRHSYIVAPTVSTLASDDEQPIEPPLPANMFAVADARETSQQRRRRKDDAELNMACTFSALDVSHRDISPSKDVAERNMCCMLLTLDVSHLEILPLNDEAEQKTPFMLVTLEVFHRETSPSKEDAA